MPEASVLATGSRNSCARYSKVRKNGDAHGGGWRDGNEGKISEVAKSGLSVVRAEFAEARASFLIFGS